MKHLSLFLALIFICWEAGAQNFSDNVTLVGLDGNIVGLSANAAAEKKKDAEDLAIMSAFNSLFYSGIDGLKDGQPMLTGKAKDYHYRFFNQKRYMNYLNGVPKTTKTDKVRGNTVAHVLVYINLKGLQAELERNQQAVSPAWQGDKKVSATAALNPTIVVVPAVTAQTGYSFDAMRNIVENDALQRYAVERVAQEFGTRGFKTRDFISMLQNSKNSQFLREGTQQDDESMFVSQLPGDIVVYVDLAVNRSGAASSAKLNLKAIEKQTAGRLSTTTFGSGEYQVSDHTKLADYAVKKMSGEFFSQLNNSFEDMVKKGREVYIEMSLAAATDWDFDQDGPASGEAFKDALDEWLRQNAHGDVYSMDNNTDKYIEARINVPLWDYEKNRSYTLSNFGSAMRRFFKTHLGDEYKAKITSAGQKMMVTIE